MDVPAAEWWRALSENHAFRSQPRREWQDARVADACLIERSDDRLLSLPGTWMCPPPQVASIEQKSRLLIDASARVAGSPSRRKK
jgi:hypothetical protein